MSCSLTGTPLENRLSEFESLVEYLDSRLFLSLDRATLAGCTSVQGGGGAGLSAAEYRGCTSELPELIETEEWLDLSPSDERSYLAAVRSGNFMAGVALPTLSRSTDQPSSAGSVRWWTRPLRTAGRSSSSPTSETCLTLSARRSRSGLSASHRVIVPSQRQQMVDDFSVHGGGAVLAAQIQAGGVGEHPGRIGGHLLCEPQVKPSLESQAIARVHRMGQVTRSGSPSPHARQRRRTDAGDPGHQIDALRRVRTRESRGGRRP